MEFRRAVVEYFETKDVEINGQPGCRYGRLVSTLSGWSSEMFGIAPDSQSLWDCDGDTED